MSTPHEPVVPERSDDDQDAGWGDRSPSEDEDVQRLRDERPPHHDRD